MANEQADTQEPETEYPLPAGYENQSVGFARAYAHAKRHGNEDKASLLYAESWQRLRRDGGVMSEFDMNQLLRSYVRDESEAGAEEASNEDESIGGKSDGGAGSERAGTGARDMNAHAGRRVRVSWAFHMTRAASTCDLNRSVPHSL